jgi:hypothetical protein
VSEGGNDTAASADTVGVLTDQADQGTASAGRSELADNTGLPEPAGGEDGQAGLRLLREAVLRALF